MRTTIRLDGQPYAEVREPGLTYYDYKYMVETSAHLVYETNKYKVTNVSVIFERVDSELIQHLYVDLVADGKAV
jgi:hypothetical protein